MGTSLRAYLLDASRERFREFLEAVEGLTEEEAQAGRRADWPRHPYHVGQDGSIAGIVHHVAAWKRVYIELLRGRNVDPHDAGPDPPYLTYAGLVTWLRRAGEEWLAACAALPGAACETPVAVPGVSPGLTPLKMMREMLEHDIEHLGQVNYLIERRKCAPPAGSHGA